jgi:hypothetical protein
VFVVRAPDTPRTGEFPLTTKCCQGLFADRGYNRYPDDPGNTDPSHRLPKIPSWGLPWLPWALDTRQGTEPGRVRKPLGRTTRGPGRPVVSFLSWFPAFWPVPRPVSTPGSLACAGIPRRKRRDPNRAERLVVACLSYGITAPTYKWLGRAPMVGPGLTVGWRSVRGCSACEHRGKLKRSCRCSRRLGTRPRMARA